MSFSSKQFVEAHAAFVQDFSPNIGPQSIYPWLAKYGREFPDPLKRPKGMRKGRMRHCYQNAARFVILRSFRPAPKKQYFYCEGFSIPKGFFPMEHAWVMDEAGNIYDPTWNDATSYFGVAFKTEFVCAEAVRTERYGIFYHRPNEKLFETPEKCIYDPTKKDKVST